MLFWVWIIPVLLYTVLSVFGRLDAVIGSLRQARNESNWYMVWSVISIKNCALFNAAFKQSRLFLSEAHNRKRIGEADNRNKNATASFLGNLCAVRSANAIVAVRQHTQCSSQDDGGNWDWISKDSFSCIYKVAKDLNNKNNHRLWAIIYTTSRKRGRFHFVEANNLVLAVSTGHL